MKPPDNFLPPTQPGLLLVSQPPPPTKTYRVLQSVPFAPSNRIMNHYSLIAAELNIWTKRLRKMQPAGAPTPSRSLVKTNHGDQHHAYCVSHVPSPGHGDAEKRVNHLSSQHLLLASLLTPHASHALNRAVSTTDPLPLAWPAL